MSATAWMACLFQGPGDGGPPLTRVAWKRDADAVLAEANALGRDLPQRELKAHLAAAGAGPGAIDESAARIEKRTREDEEARTRAAERQRLAEEPALAAQEAERPKLEQEQDLSGGGGISLQARRAT